MAQRRPKGMDGVGANGKYPAWYNLPWLLNQCWLHLHSFGSLSLLRAQNFPLSLYTIFLSDLKHSHGLWYHWYADYSYIYTSPLPWVLCSNATVYQLLSSVSDTTFMTNLSLLIVLISHLLVSNLSTSPINSNTKIYSKSLHPFSLSPLPPHYSWFLHLSLIILQSILGSIARGIILKCRLGHATSLFNFPVSSSPTLSLLHSYLPLSSYTGSTKSPQKSNSLLTQGQRYPHKSILPPGPHVSEPVSFSSFRAA